MKTSWKPSLSTGLKIRKREQLSPLAELDTHPPDIAPGFGTGLSAEEPATGDGRTKEVIFPRRL